jgi:hypothetical protein
MASSVAKDAVTTRPLVQPPAALGMTAAVLFVTVFSADGWHRVGYDPVRMFVSELSLGAPVTGALVVAFGRGLSMYFRSGVSACHERKRIALKPA